MIQIQKQWFAPVPWESVVSINQALCQAKKNDHDIKPPAYQAAQKLWESSIAKRMTLQEALNVCQRCQNLAPFHFYNANTFAAIGRTLVEDGLKLFPPVEAQIIRTTVSHYIAGMIGRKELAQVLSHFEKLWLSAPHSASATHSAPVARPTEAREHLPGAAV